METPAELDKIDNVNKKLSNSDIDLRSDINGDKSVAEDTVNLSNEGSVELSNGTRTSIHKGQQDGPDVSGDASITNTRPEVFAFVGASHTREESPFPGEPPIKRPHSPEKLESESIKRKCDDQVMKNTESNSITIDMSAHATGPVENNSKVGFSEEIVMVGGEMLPATVTKLQGPKDSVLYLVGTAHFSIQSQEDVAKVIQLVQPHVVTIELCKSRISLLQLDEETVLREAQNINFAKLHATIEQNGLVNGIMYTLLLSFTASLTKQLGMAPGGEFRRAMMEAGKVKNCCVHLGDRPINITILRALSSLSWWQTLKLAWHMLFSKDITQEEVERCKQRDLLEEMLAEMAGEFPALGRVFVTERDIYLAHSLALACQPVPTPEGPVPAKVVGVVGMGHVAGITQNWGKSASEKYEQPNSNFHCKGINYWSNGLGSIQNSTCAESLTANTKNMEINEDDAIPDPYCHNDVWLVYTPGNIPGPGCDMNLFTEQIASGCSCENNCCEPSSMCSCRPKYSGERTLLNRIGPVLECNSNCKCSIISCSNRVIQNGPIFGLEIFDTKTSKGLGLRTLNYILKDKFICEYAGEIIGEEESRLRSVNQINNYIIVVNEHCSGDNIITTRVDPTFIGNIGRYANHSCSPTAYMVLVRTNSLVPHLALFAKLDMEPLTEITFDYGGGEMNPKLSNTPCLCYSVNCRRFLPHDPCLI